MVGGLAAELPATSSRALLRSFIFEQETDMKSTLALLILAVLLGGCAIGPAGYGDNRNGYYQDRSYSRGDGYYRDRGYYGDGYYYYRGDGYNRDYSYRGGYTN